jgi:hypothetical protein
MRRALAGFFLVLAILGCAAPLTVAQESGKGHKHPKPPKHSQHGGGAKSEGTKTSEAEPSELPLKWLFVSLGVSLLIGAAGGEIFFSLSPKGREDQTPGRPAPT